MDILCSLIIGFTSGIILAVSDCIMETNKLLGISMVIISIFLICMSITINVIKYKKFKDNKLHEMEGLIEKLPDSASVIIRDDDGNIIHYKSKIGYEYIAKYDYEHHMLYYKDNVGHEEWCDYDTKGNLIHKKYADGYEYWWEYDDNNNEIHFKSSHGHEVFKTYDENGNLKYWKNIHTK